MLGTTLGRRGGPAGQTETLAFLLAGEDVHGDAAGWSSISAGASAGVREVVGRRIECVGGRAVVAGGVDESEGFGMGVAERQGQRTRRRHAQGRLRHSDPGGCSSGGSSDVVVVVFLVVFAFSFELALGVERQSEVGDGGDRQEGILILM